MSHKDVNPGAKNPDWEIIFGDNQPPDWTDPVRLRALANLLWTSTRDDSPLGGEIVNNLAVLAGVSVAALTRLADHFERNPHHG
jgi:hypothetical protein